MLPQSQQNRPGRSVFGLLLLLNTVMLIGCAISQTPERPEYTGSNTIERVHPAQIVGIWEVKELNPIENQRPQTSTISYMIDSTVKGHITMSSERTGLSGDMQFELIGTWLLEKDVVSHIDMQLRSADDSTIGTLLSTIVNQQKNLSGQATIYELSKTRMVMVGTDGRAMEYTRR